MKNFITIFISIIPLYSFSQGPTIDWQNTIGGNSDESVACIKQTSDGGYILGGSSISDATGDKTEPGLGSYDYWIVKINATGEIEWQNTVGGNSTDYLQSLQQTTDGGFIVGGWSLSGISGDKTEACLGNYDYWIVKLNSIGEIEWQNTIGTNDYDEFHEIQQTDDGGYILGGIPGYGISGDKTEVGFGLWDYWIVKLNSTGNIMWEKTFGGSLDDILYSIQKTFDGGYILGGWSNSGISGVKSEAAVGSHDYWVIKLDALGEIEWQNTIGGNDYDVLYSVRQTFDGGYIVGGWSPSGVSGDKTESNFGGYDYWIIKLNTSGDIEWDKTFGGNNNDHLISLQETTDGGYFLGGFSYSGNTGNKTEANIGSYDYWVIKLDPFGGIEWQNTIGGSAGDGLYSIQQISDGGYILGGHSYSNISGDKTENNVGPGSHSDYWVVKLASTWFCEIPTGLFADGITSSSVTLNWDEIEDAEQYTLSLWKADDFETLRRKHVFTNSFTTAEVLTPSTTYGWRVKSVCYGEGIISPYSDIYYFTTHPLRPVSGLNSLYFQIYPNPSSDKFMISINQLGNTPVSLLIVDMAGNIIYSNTFKDMILEVNVRGLSAGIYFIEVQMDGNTYVEKFIKL